jgi:hypothetical protein
MTRILSSTLVLLLACSSYTDNTACTLIGCRHGLYVQFSGAHQPGPWTVEVSTTGEAPRTVSCAADLHCAPAFFEDFLPSTVTVRVTANGKTEQHAGVTPTPAVTRPNGPQCGPECNSPYVTLPFPQP